MFAHKFVSICREFLEPGAPCEINIDGKTMEKVQQGLKAPSRFTFDVAAEHVYTLLLKKDCYPRFIRSEHYKSLLANAIQPSQKKRFFGFGGAAKKKASTTIAPNPALLTQVRDEREFMDRKLNLGHVRRLRLMRSCLRNILSLSCEKLSS